MHRERRRPRVLGPAAAALQAVRLRGPRERPDAFGSTLADDVSVPLADVAARYGLDHGAAPAAERIAVAFDSAECHRSGRAFRRLAELHGRPPNAWNHEP